MRSLVGAIKRVKIEWIGDDKDQAFVTRGWFFRRTAHIQITPNKGTIHPHANPDAQPIELNSDNSQWTYVETGRPCDFSSAMFLSRVCALNQVKTEAEWVRVRSRPRRTLRLLPQVKAPKSERLVKP